MANARVQRLTLAAACRDHVSHARTLLAIALLFAVMQVGGLAIWDAAPTSAQAPDATEDASDLCETIAGSGSCTSAALADALAESAPRRQAPLTGPLAVTDQSVEVSMLKGLAPLIALGTMKPLYEWTADISRNGDTIKEIRLPTNKEFDETNIVRAELLIGGSVIDRLDDHETFPALRALYGMSGLPFHVLKSDHPDDPDAPRFGLPLVALQSHQVQLRLLLDKEVMGHAYRGYVPPRSCFADIQCWIPYRMSGNARGLTYEDKVAQFGIADLPSCYSDEASPWLLVAYESFDAEQRRRMAQVGQERPMYQVEHLHTDGVSRTERLVLHFKRPVAALLVRHQERIGSPRLLVNGRELQLEWIRVNGFDVTVLPRHIDTSIDDLEINMSPAPPDAPRSVEVHAVEPNVLRIMSGMGGLADGAGYDTAAPYIAPRPALAIEVSGEPACVESVGQVITYTITVSNIGDTDLTGLELSGTLADDATPIAGDAVDNGVLGIGATRTYKATYAVTQTDFDAGRDVVKSIDVLTDQTDAVKGLATTPMAPTPEPTPEPSTAPTPEPTPTPKPNKPPKANAGGPYVVDEGSRVRLDGRASEDPDGSIKGYRWAPKGRLDDSTKKRPWFAGIDDGATKLTLRVTDDDGATHADAAKVTVRNVAPTPERVPPTSIAHGEPLYGNFDFTDPGVRDTHRVIVYWGDGSKSNGDVTEKNGKGSAYVGHTYDEPGTYDAEFIVIDDDGAPASSFFTVTVE